MSGGHDRDRLNAYLGGAIPTLGNFIRHVRRSDEFRADIQLPASLRYMSTCAVAWLKAIQRDPEQGYSLRSIYRSELRRRRHGLSDCGLTPQI
jgi:hypothetical protein